MAHLGRGLDRNRLRRTTLCRAPATIVDDETFTDIKLMYKESMEELWSAVTLKKFVSGSPSTVYSESPNKTFTTYTSNALINEDPQEKELIDLGIREPVDIIAKFLADDLKALTLWDSINPIKTDDRILFRGIEYNIHQVGRGQNYKGENVLVWITGKVWSKQAPRTVPA